MATRKTAKKTVAKKATKKTAARKAATKRTYARKPKVETEVEVEVNKVEACDDPRQPNQEEPTFSVTRDDIRDLKHAGAREARNSILGDEYRETNGLSHLQLSVLTQLTAAMDEVERAERALELAKDARRRAGLIAEAQVKHGVYSVNGYLFNVTNGAGVIVSKLGHQG